MAESAVVGCVLGTAVGDALGLPYERVSRLRAVRLLGKPDRFRFLFRRGMVSDDTEHTCMVAQSLVHSDGDIDLFTRDFARRLRWWALSLPAGTGRATIRACMKLWLGKSPTSSGVFSAGNGPAMRSAIFGAAFDSVDQIVSYVRASSRITHTDPKAEYAAVAVALACRHSRMNERPDRIQFVQLLSETLGPDGAELTSLVEQAAASVGRGEPISVFAKSLGLENWVSAYAYHTVPVAIHIWMTHPRDYRSAVIDAIQCGGDADTTAAIVGGIVGAAIGEDGIDKEWLSRIWEWPRSVSWMRKLALVLQASVDDSVDKSSLITPEANFLGICVRNLLFLGIVLVHGFRRLAPRY